MLILKELMWEFYFNYSAVIMKEYEILLKYFEKKKSEYFFNIFNFNKKLLN